MLQVIGTNTISKTPKIINIMKRIILTHKLKTPIMAHLILLCNRFFTEMNVKTFQSKMRYLHYSGTLRNAEYSQTHFA